MNATDIDSSLAQRFVKDWLTEAGTRSRIHAAVSRALQSVEAELIDDVNWRVPRQKQMRSREFDSWIATYRKRIQSAIAREVNSEFPFVALDDAMQTVQLAIDETMPDIQERMERILDDQKKKALRALALEWTSRRISDGVLLGLPSFDGDIWSVPLYDRVTRARIAAVELNRDGDVLSSDDEVRRQIARAA